MVTNNKIIGPTILSVALLTVMAGAAISPAIANIAKAFPSASPGLIKLVLTLPSLVVIPFALISGWLCDFLGKRTVLLAGLTLYFPPIIIDSIGKQLMPESQGSGSPFIVACSMSIGGIVLAVIQIIIINNKNKHHVKPKEM